METTKKIAEMVQEVLDSGDFVDQCILSDNLHELVASLEAETHDEEMAITKRDAGRRLPKHYLSMREWQTLDWFVGAVVERHGLHRETDPKKRTKLYERFRKVLHENLDSAINARADFCAMQADAFAAAAKEQDAKAAFRMYVEAAAENHRLVDDLEGNKDFQERVMPAVIALPFDQQAWAQDEFDVVVPEGYDYYNALVMIYEVSA